MDDSHDNPDSELSSIADLIRTRPEAFDFGDAPDPEPLSDQYKVDMDARRPLWLPVLMMHRHKNRE